MKNVGMTIGAMVVILSVANIASADTFDAGGANEFTIDFVPISGSTNPPSDKGFVSYDYRIGAYEITNDQWDKFQASYGTVTGSDGRDEPGDAYDESAYWTGTDVPANSVSWYECAQFVNYLNTSTGHQAAYKFTGTQGQSDYSLAVWGLGDVGYDSSNPFRNSNAFYFLPMRNEWVKAAYWNGTNLQDYATKAGESLIQGDGTSGTGWNYDISNVYATDPPGPWAVGSGSEELNGTYDMMGNVREWTESPYHGGDYFTDSLRVLRGGSAFDSAIPNMSYYRRHWIPSFEYSIVGFRVASVPEPCSLVLLSLGGLMLRKRRPSESVRFAASCDERPDSARIGRR